MERLGRLLGRVDGGGCKACVVLVVVGLSLTGSCKEGGSERDAAALSPPPSPDAPKDYLPTLDYGEAADCANGKAAQYPGFRIRRVGRRRLVGEFSVDLCELVLDYFPPPQRMIATAEIYEIWKGEAKARVEWLSEFMPDEDVTNEGCRPGCVKPRSQEWGPCWRVDTVQVRPTFFRFQGAKYALEVGASVVAEADVKDGQLVIWDSGSFLKGLNPRRHWPLYERMDSAPEAKVGPIPRPGPKDGSAGE